MPNPSIIGHKLAVGFFGLIVEVRQFIVLEAVIKERQHHSYTHILINPGIELVHVAGKKNGSIVTVCPSGYLFH